MKTYRIANFLTVFGVLIHKCTGEVDWEKHKPAICVKDKGYKVNSSGNCTEEGFTDCDYEFALQIYLKETWKDSALNLEHAKIEGPEDVPIYVSDCIRTPFTIFPSVKSDEVMGGLFPNVVFKAHPGGYVTRISRHRLTIYCQMDFKKYPMDKQQCYLLITTSETCILILKFSFTRHLTSTLVNSYIPSYLIVCLSWVSFWLDPMAVPGRVTLGVTALLTLSTQIVHSRSYLPVLAYMTAMDIWLFGCLIMVFLSLIEFTIANMAARKKEKVYPPSRATREGSWIPNEIENNPADFSLRLKACWMLQRRCTKNNTKKRGIDEFARIIFPFLMTVFSSVYWIYLLKP